jgi:hypothetical protein
MTRQCENEDRWAVHAMLLKSRVPKHSCVLTSLLKIEIVYSGNRCMYGRCHTVLKQNWKGELWRIGYWQRSRWCNAYRACHWTQGSGAQIRSRTTQMAIKIRSRTSFGGEAKPLAPCLFLFLFFSLSFSIWRPITCAYGKVSLDTPRQCGPTGGPLAASGSRSLLTRS